MAGYPWVIKAEYWQTKLANPEEATPAEISSKPIVDVYRGFHWGIGYCGTHEWDYPLLNLKVEDGRYLVSYDGGKWVAYPLSDALLEPDTRAFLVALAYQVSELKGRILGYEIIVVMAGGSKAARYYLPPDEPFEFEIISNGGKLIFTQRGLSVKLGGRNVGMVFSPLE